jgi:small GTP-binding protein
MAYSHSIKRISVLDHFQTTTDLCILCLVEKISMFPFSLSKAAPQRVGFVLSRCFARQGRAAALPIPKREKRLDVVIFGLPNVGKSVLLNCLIEHKIAATTHKRHTTRGEILGFFQHRNTQLAFYDTPGYVTHENALSNDMKALRNVGLKATSKADVILLCVNAEQIRLSGKQQDWFADMAKVALENAKAEVILVLNKVDLVEPKIKLLDTTHQLVSLMNGVKLSMDQVQEAQLDTTTFMISALKNDGVNDLKNYLLTLAKHKAWVIPGPGIDSDTDTDTDTGARSGTSPSAAAGPHKSQSFDSFTTQTPEQLVEESILQVMLQQTHEEIPYIANIVCKKIQYSTNDVSAGGGGGTTGSGSVLSEQAERKVVIHCDIEVDTTKQQRIVIGQGGRTLVKIRQGACALLEKIFKVDTCILQCSVKTRLDRKGKVKSGSSLQD